MRKEIPKFGKTVNDFNSNKSNHQGPHRNAAIPGVFPGNAERLLGIGCWDF
jgi:hypothetical protein